MNFSLLKKNNIDSQMHFLKPIRSNNGNVKYEILKCSRFFVFKKKQINQAKNAHFFKNKACNILSIRSIVLLLIIAIQLRVKKK